MAKIIYQNFKGNAFPLIIRQNQDGTNEEYGIWQKLQSRRRVSV